MMEVRTGAGRLKLKLKSVVAYKYMGTAERPSNHFWKEIFFNLCRHGPAEQLHSVSSLHGWRPETDAPRLHRSSR